MVLRLVVTPDFASVSDAEEIALGDVWDLGAIRFGVDLRLVDREKLKEYSVIADTSGVRWSSTGSGGHHHQRRADACLRGVRRP